MISKRGVDNFDHLLHENIKVKNEPETDELCQVRVLEPQVML